MTTSTTHRLPRFIVSLGLAAWAAALGTASAATLNWTGGALGDGTSWNDSANWGGTAVGTNNDLIIATRNGSGDLPAQTLGGGVIIRSLTFDNSAGRYPAGGLFVNASNNTIAFDTPGITNLSLAANTTVALSRAASSAFNVQLAPGQNTIDVGANSSFTMGPINGLATGTGAAFTAGSGNAAITFLTKTGPGMLFLGANSTFSGGLTISGGTVVMNGSPAQLVANGGSGVTLNGGTLRVQGATAQSGNGRVFQVGSSIGTIEVDATKSFGIGGNFNNVTGETGVLRKTGAGVLAFEMGKSQATYTGGTIVEEGTFRMVNQINLGGNTTIGVQGVTVKGGAILQAGSSLSNDQAIISGDSTLEQNSRLEIGVWAATSGNVVSTTGFLTFNGNVDISGAADSTLPAFIWNLKTPTTSDKATVGLVLNIGSGDLEFSDFTFTGETGIAVGTYTLFDTPTAISGTLGSSLSGIIGGIGGFTGTLGISGDGTDLILTVAVPEPSTCVLLGLGGVVSAMAWRRFARMKKDLRS